MIEENTFAKLIAEALSKREDAPTPTPLWREFFTFYLVELLLVFNAANPSSSNFEGNM